jgi:Domain of unknown function (DUF4471)
MHEFTTHSVYSDTPVSQITEIDDEFDPLRGIKIIFLPCDPAETFVKKHKKYTGSFDAIFISSALAHRIKDAKSLLKEDGKAVVENATYILSLKPEQKEMFTVKVDEMAKETGLQKVGLDGTSEFLVYK